MCLQLLGSPTTLHKTSLPGSSAKAGEDGPFATRPWRPGVAPRGSWPKTRSNLEIHFGSFWHFQAASTISNLRHANIPINIIQYPIYVYVYIYISQHISQRFDLVPFHQMPCFFAAVFSRHRNCCRVWKPKISSESWRPRRTHTMAVMVR